MNFTSTPTSGYGEVLAVAGFASVDFRLLSAISVGLLAILTFSSSKVGRRVLHDVVRVFEPLLGGPKHTLKLPGPVGFPLLGNLPEMRKGHIQALMKWKEQYGDAIRVTFGEREALVLNSHRALAQTVVAQGPSFQSRPIFKLYHSEFADSGIWTVGTSPYSDRLARTRKAFSAQCAPRILPIYTAVNDPKLRKLIELVSEIAGGPALDMADILHRFGSGQVSEQLVGTHLNDEEVSLIAENETNIFRQRTVGMPERDYVPIMRAYGKTKHVLSRVLGIKMISHDAFEQKAKNYRKIQHSYVDKMLADLRVRIKEGDETPSLIGNILRTNALTDEEILLAFYTGIAAGINLGYALTWTVGYLANHPELQEKGYQAIQEVYGGQAPNPHDYDRVEYIKALYTEGSRYYTPVRLGFPRESLEGGSYNGVPIPAGTLTIMNLYLANKDPAVYDRPNEFLPERWLDGHKGRTDVKGEVGDKLGVPILTFGAGRRVCPGIDMANRSLYACLLLFIHFFKWERSPLSEEEKLKVFPLFRAERECSLEMDPLEDTATPTEAQAIPWSAGIKFTARNPDACREWLASELVI